MSQIVVFVSEGPKLGYHAVADLAEIKQHLGDGLTASFSVPHENKIVYFSISSPAHMAAFEAVCQSVEFDRFIRFDWQIAATVFVELKHCRRFVRTPDRFIHEDDAPIGYKLNSFFRPVGPISESSSPSPSE